MRDVVTKMGRHGLVFVTGVLLSRLIGFVLMPFLVRALGSERYGIHDLLAQTGQLVAMAAALGVPSAVFRWYVHEAKDDAERQAAAATGFRFTAMSTLVLGLLVALPAGPVARLLTGEQGFTLLLLLVLLTYFVQNLRNVCISILRAEYRSGRFLAVYCTEFLLCLALNLWFVVYRGLGVAGLVWSNLIGAVVAFALAVLFVPGAVKGGFDGSRLRPMLAFGLPLVPQAFAFFLLDTLDRYCLRGLLDGTGPVGVYSRGATFATILHAALIMPLQLLWPNVFYELAKRPQGGRDLGRCASWYAAAAAFLAIGLAACARPLVELMLTPEFAEAAAVIPILAVSLALLGAGEVVRVGFLIRGRTALLPVLVFVAVAVNVALNFLLIPWLGVTGAAWSSLVAYAVLLVITFVFAQRHYHVTYEWGRLLKVAVAAAAVLPVAIHLPATGSGVADLFLRGGTVALGLPLLLVLLRFPAPVERAFARESLAKLLGRARPRRGA